MVLEAVVMAGQGDPGVVTEGGALLVIIIIFAGCLVYFVDWLKKGDR